MSEYPEEGPLDEAVRAAVRVDHPGALVVGWVVCAVSRDASEDGGTRHTYFCPAGQPKYASVGMLTIVSDWLRGIGEDEDEQP